MAMTSTEAAFRSLASVFYDEKMAHVDRQQARGEEFVNKQREIFVQGVLADTSAQDRLLRLNGLLGD